ncbi:MAG TPA: hypothetical protein PLF13_00725 [candidate division Zixibacteria bacterium]|nr:hypothetical protein [candidate division Zixibacteria bacterium]
MELSSNIILDMALNIAGYLAAGALSLIVYSAFSNRRTETAEAAASPTLAAAAPGVMPPKPTEQTGSFVNLSNPKAPETAPTPTRPAVVPTTRMARTDRNDIHRIAREMLKAGASAEKIQRVLPISETELQLLTLKAN